MSHASSRPIVIGIPAKDEADHIAACLHALAWQHGVGGQQVVLLVNNTTDGTAVLVRELQPTLPIAVHVIERQLPRLQANAGHARRLAMGEAARLAGPHGVLLSTDADSRPAPDWLLRNLQALSRGADAVAGRAILAPEDAGCIPARLHEDDARECAYSDVLEEVACLLDPDPHDPWPRHAEHSGASICATAAAFARCGGIPDVPMGEDRAFFDALRRHDAVIRHAPEVRVEVSGRIWGRAAGGMADTIRRRLAAPDPELDDRLEPAIAWLRRHRLRAQARSAWKRDDVDTMRNLARRLQLPFGEVQQAFGQPWFGAAWAALEARSPVLERRSVAVADLPGQMRAAVGLRDILRRAQPARSEGVPILPSLAVASPS